MTSFTIRTPCSSANIGPGFDVIGLALSLYLELTVEITSPVSATSSEATKKPPLNCILSYTGEGEGDISLDPEINLITRVALYVLRCHDEREFPPCTSVHISNPIPLGRGLGSSGAAVVAGVVLASEVGKYTGSFSLDRKRMLDYCLMVERHPDNIAAALNGGFVGTYLNELAPEQLSRLEIPLAEVMPTPAGGEDTGLSPPEPPLNIGHFRHFKWAPEIRCLVIIPEFEVPTHKAREVLPSSYSKKDVVFNLQRIAVLVHALGESPPNPEDIHLAMQDRVHQQYRQPLIPGLEEVLASASPRSADGFLGACLSGAGPTILALCAGNQDQIEKIADKLTEPFKQRHIECRHQVLRVAEDGTTVTYGSRTSFGNVLARWISWFQRALPH